MNKATKWIVALLVMATLFSCRKGYPVGVDDPKDPDTEVVIEGAYRSKHGEVTGVAVEKTIGPEGGELVYSEMGMKLKIPPGAVDKPIKFSVQQVTFPPADADGLAAKRVGLAEQAPESIVSEIYRLLPEDVEFKEDVEISLPFYSGNTFQQGTQRPVYQDKHGYWHVLTAGFQTNFTRPITVKTRHFSDWGVNADVILKRTGKEVLDKGESSDFRLIYTPIIPQDEMDEAIMGTVVGFYADKIVEWRIYGGEGSSAGGKLTGGKSSTATFTASSTYPPGGGTSAVGVEVVIQLNDKGALIRLFDYVTVLHEEYCFGLFGNGHISLGEEKVEVSGGTESVYLNYYGTRNDRMHIEAPHSSGKQVFGEKVMVSHYQRLYFNTTYTNCVPSEVLYCKGDIVFIGENEGLISGDIKGEMRQRKEGSYYCFEDPTPFRVEFRYRKR
ncbi:ZU5 domain-containing protein [bacterium A37T11]|nr:ZU5 domain-containing protein [bacterium A37T11]